MAKTIPSIEQCLKSKQTPTKGELFLRYNFCFKL